MQGHDTTITILGAGYVGLSTAALLSNCGYTVYLIEPNQERLNTIKTGQSFFYEEGIDPLIAAGLQHKTLIPTDSYEISVPNSSIVFSCVGTPDNPDGSHNLTYVFSAAEHAAKRMKPDSIFVQKSTVPVGTGAELQSLFAELGSAVAYVSNPEFLRESTAISDTLWPDRVVAGSDNELARSAVLNVYKSLAKDSEALATTATIAAPPVVPQTEYIGTSIPSAELIKVTANAFLALKISFANSIAMLSDKVGADVAEVMAAVGADKRIGKQFLQAGRGYGGGCFPKDVDGLIQSGQQHGVDLTIMKAAQAVNQQMPRYIIDKLTQQFGTVKNKRIAVLGLAFKSGTSDVRKSPGIAIANLLVKAGAEVSAHDPQANSEATHELDNAVLVANEIQNALQQIDAVVVATYWPEYAADTLLPILPPGVVLVDAVNAYNPTACIKQGITYIGIGR